MDGCFCETLSVFATAMSSLYYSFSNAFNSPLFEFSIRRFGLIFLVSTAFVLAASMSVSYSVVNFFLCPFLLKFDLSVLFSMIFSLFELSL